MYFNSFGGGAVCETEFSTRRYAARMRRLKPSGFVPKGLFCVYGAKFTSFSNTTPVYVLLIFYIIVRNYASSSMFPVREFSKIPSLN